MYVYYLVANILHERCVLLCSRLVAETEGVSDSACLQLIADIPPLRMWGAFTIKSEGQTLLDQNFAGI